MATWTDYLLGPVLVLAVAALATLSVLQHALPIGPELSVVLLIFDTRVLVAVAVAIFGASFLLYLYYLRGEDASRLVHGGRSVEAIVPVHEDADVMDRSVEALLASDYADLSITIVCEPDDTDCLERATDLGETHEAVSVLRNTTHEGSKAGALNAAIERSDADVVGLFDADQEPDPQFVPHAVASLEEHDAVRGRNLPDPSGGLLEAVVYYEYLVLFFLPQKFARALFGFNFAGTRGILLEASVFDEVGYFREDTLTEDLEFSHRCHAAGLSTGELLYYPILEAPAHTVRDWWGQRVRWMSGQVAVSAGRLENWRELFGRRVVGSLVMSLGTFVAGTLMAMTVPKLALGLVTSPLVVGGGLVVVFAILVATRLVDNRTSTLSGVGLAWLLLPVAVTLYGLVIVQVVFEHALGIESDWYSIEKAEGSG
jgi:cellulose synthase/poly-beta-1,6-N-acetylglucosamine synthase-like glycosyltransferase